MGSIGGLILGSFASKLGELIADKLGSNFNLVTLEALRKNLKTLSVKACDVEEQIKHAERSGQKKRKREVEEWLVEVKSIETQVVELRTRVESPGFIKWLMDGREAAQLNEQVSKLLEQTSHFGELVVDICGIRGVKIPTTRMVGEAFEKNSEKIWSLLERNSTLSIGVYGMGGVGKTTLAKDIYNRLQETYGDGSVFWVTVSQEFTIKSLQERIAHVLGVQLSGEDDETIRALRVSRALSEMKNAILILDDVWKYIDLLKVGVPLSVDCCRLILTTRSKQVCEQMLCQKLIEVQSLGEDEAWKLFREKLTDGKEIKLDPEVEAIVKHVAKFCDGLPLGIITMAATMRGETTIHAWRNALVELTEHFSDQDGRWGCEVFRVLKYSFDRLHESESKDFNSRQLCFLHFSLYPEDKIVEKEDLIKDFISEGLLDTRKSRTEQFDLGNVILDKLVSVCLFEDEFECVKMHDLVRGMALKVCEGKYMVRAGDLSLEEITKKEEWKEDLEKVSLMDNGIRRIEYGICPNCPNLSTLLLQNNPLEFIPDSFFRKMQGLCTLNLSNTEIWMLPNSLSDLNSLKALILERCYMLEKVPYLGNLKALRELNLSRTAIREVPQGVEELLNLRLLSMYGSYNLEIVPSGLLHKLGSLQYVSFPSHLKASMQVLKNLKELEEFRGRVENVIDFNHIIKSHRMRSYVIEVGSYDDKYPKYGYYNKELYLNKCSLVGEKVSEQDIELLEMKRCEGLSKCLSDGITSLRELRLKACGGIEFILSAQESPSDPLPSLEHIQLLFLDDFKGVIDTPAPTQCMFLSLESLEIEHCPQIRKLRLPVTGFPNVEYIRIQKCSEIEEIFEDDERVESVTLPKLALLWLEELPRLECVCRKAIICNSIGIMRIIKCPRYEKKLPVHLDVPPPPTLRRICVEREWWESLEWDNPHLPPLLQPFVHYSEQESSERSEESYVSLILVNHLPL